MLSIKMVLGQFHAGRVGIAMSSQTHSHKREIGSMGHFHKQRIGIADIAGAIGRTELRKINNRACASLINGASSIERIRSEPEFRRSAERGMRCSSSAILLLILLAALPLGRTFLNQKAGGSPVVFVHRLYRDLAYIAAAVLGIVCFETALTISLQDYWFDELGQRYRYWLALGLRAGIFVTVLFSVGIFVGYNLRALCRPLPAVPKSAPWFAAFIFSAVVAFSATTLWVPLLGFLGATATGTSDPVFGNDISFYLLALPWYDDLVDIVMTVLVITIALWAVIGLGLYPRSGRPWDHFADYLGNAVRKSLRMIGAVDAGPDTKRDDLGAMDTPGPGAGSAALPRVGRVPLPRPLLSHHRWTFAGRCRRLVCRRQFLDPGIRRRRGRLGCRRLHLDGGSLRDADSHLVADAAVALGCPLRAVCGPLPRSGDRSVGSRAPLCRSEPDNPRAALSAQKHRRHAGSLQSRRGVDAKSGNSRSRPRRSPARTSTRTQQRCETPASGTGARSNPSSSRSRACGRTIPLPASISTAT